MANAAKLNASAVLIYPDPEDYSFEDTTELFGHVSEQSDSYICARLRLSHRDVSDLSVLLIAWGS